MLDKLKDLLKAAFGAAWAAAAGWKWYVWCGLFCFLVGGCVGSCVTGWKRDVFGTDGPVGATGWVDDPAAVQAAVATMPRPVFAQHGLTADDKDALLHQIVKRAIGKHVPPHNQGQVGCCVGEGASVACEYLAGVMKAEGRGDWKAVSSESIYALSRVEVGGGRLGSEDGSVGAWAAKAVTEYGSLPRENLGSVDLTAFSESRARDWGRRGLPDDLEATARQYKVGMAAKLASAEECRVALTNMYPIVICSQKGFSMTRDRDGFCREQGQWGHCMGCVAYRADKRGFLFIQSWGEKAPTGPVSLDQPPNSFWVTWQVMDQICREGDTFAYSQFAGFPRQNIDNFVLDPAPKVRRHLAFALTH